MVFMNRNRYSFIMMLPFCLVPCRPLNKNNQFFKQLKGCREQSVFSSSFVLITLLKSMVKKRRPPHNKGQFQPQETFQESFNLLINHCKLWQTPHSLPAHCTCGCYWPMGLSHPQNHTCTSHLILTCCWEWWCWHPPQTWQWSPIGLPPGCQLSCRPGHNHHCRSWWGGPQCRGCCRGPLLPVGLPGDSWCWSTGRTCWPTEAQCARETANKICYLSWTMDGEANSFWQTNKTWL